MYINIQLLQLCFLLRKNIMSYRDINLILFFNNNSICFIINIYSNNQQNILKYLKDIKINISNILIMIGDFNIRDNDWNLLYFYHSVHTDTLIEIADAFNLRLFIFIIQVSTWYIDNSNKSNLVVDLMFLWVNLLELWMMDFILFFLFLFSFSFYFYFCFSFI